MTTSLLLTNDTWDLTVDSAGNIALAPSDLYASAQDVANAARLFLGEMWYDTTQGVPYLESILGHFFSSLTFVQAKLQQAAFSVPGVLAANVNLVLNDRLLTGDIEIQTAQGAATVSTPGGNRWYITAVSPF